MERPADIVARNSIVALYESTFGRRPPLVLPLQAHASKRQIFRLHASERSLIGVYHADRAENRAFIGYTAHFRAHGLPVPEILAVNADETAYLEEDLGDTTLLDVRNAGRGSHGELSPEAAKLYHEAVRLLPEFQIRAGRSIDVSLCTQGDRFDGAAILRDMRFFRESFVKLLGVEFDLIKLSGDFEELARFLDRSESPFFMYRDFQARNIMVRNGALAFIDYQSGRRGALQYDLVSLLYQSSAELPPEFRKELLESYFTAAEALTPINREQFIGNYHGFIFLRLMQVLGTYGEQGLRQGKAYFRNSIPPAVGNLAHLLDTVSLPVDLPELTRVFREVIAKFPPEARRAVDARLAVRIVSFSFKYGRPPSHPEHGGGFVFDCRGIPNPGREERFKHLTGLDREVREFIESRSEAEEFFGHVTALVEQTVRSYVERGFASIVVGFGCTGGQHRSVYFSERLASHLRQREQLVVEVEHSNLPVGGGLRGVP